MSDTLRSKAIRLASGLPKSDPTRRKILGALSSQARRAAQNIIRSSQWRRELPNIAESFTKRGLTTAKEIIVWLDSKGEGISHDFTAGEGLFGEDAWQVDRLLAAEVARHIAEKNSR